MLKNSYQSFEKPTDRSGKAYERLIARVMIRLFGLSDSGAVTCNVHLPGASGVSHEIDLLLRIPLRKGGTGGLAVECKDQARPVFKEKVAAFCEVLRDLNAALKPSERLAGLMVSGSGFQAGAVELAAHCGLHLFEIREPSGKDWQQYVRRFVKECKTADPRAASLRGMEVSLRSNERVQIFPKEGRPGPGWDYSAPLIREAESLLFTDGTNLRTLPEYLSTLSASGRDGAKRIAIRPEKGELTHLVKDGRLPVSRLVYTFDDLTEEAEDTILWNGERP